MAGPRSGLVTTSPVGPAEPVIRVVDGLDDECDEQALALVAGEWDRLTRPGVVGVFVQEFPPGRSGGRGVEQLELDPALVTHHVDEFRHVFLYPLPSHRVAGVVGDAYRESRGRPRPPAVRRPVVVNVQELSLTHR